MDSKLILTTLLLVAASSAVPYKTLYDGMCDGWTDTETLPKGMSCYTDYDCKIFCTYVRDQTTVNKTCDLMASYSAPPLVSYDLSCTMDSAANGCVMVHEMDYTFLSFHVMIMRMTCRDSSGGDEVVVTGKFKPSCNIQLYGPTVSCAAHNCTFKSYEHERLDGTVSYLYQVSKDNGVTWSDPKKLTGDPLEDTTFVIEGLEDGVPTSIKVSVAYTPEDRFGVNTNFGKYTTYKWTP